MQGRCLCGAVKFQTGDCNHVHACHCGNCRRWGGGPALAIPCGTDMKFEGEDGITRYASSEWAERGFCKHCGTHLFTYVRPTGDYYVFAGLFEDQSAFDLVGQIFIDRKPAYYGFSNDTENLTEQQFYEKYAP